MTGVRLALAPAVVHFAPSAAAIPVVRAGTVRLLKLWRVEPEAIATAELVVSELATNAIKASDPRFDFVAVRLTATAGHVVVEVWSRPDAFEIWAMRPSEDNESGRGLAIVEAVATRWDAYRAKNGGIVVWARFPGAIIPAPRADHDATPLPTREVQPVPEPLWPVEFTTDPAVIARVADRLRALHPWHERQTV